MTEYTDHAFRVRLDGTIISKVVGVTREPGYRFAADVLMRARAMSFLAGSRPHEDPDSMGAVLHREIYHPEYEETAGVLVPDPANPHDENAVEVHVPLLEARVGFLPAPLAACVAPLLHRDEERYRVSVWAVANLVNPEYPGIRCMLTPTSVEVESVEDRARRYLDRKLGPQHREWENR